MTTAQDTSPTPAQTGTAYHWVMTVQTHDGRQGTNDGLVDVVPGLHTHQSAYTEVLLAMREWVGTDNITVLFFSLTSNQF